MANITNDRNTILTQLKSDMLDKMHVGNGYNFTPGEIKRGIYTYEQCSIKPAIYFWCYRDEAAGAFANCEERRLHIYIYGYCDTNYVSDNKDIHDLADDLEYFLYNDFTYTDDTALGDAIVYESGENSTGSMFEIECRVRYEKDTTAH